MHNWGGPKGMLPAAPKLWPLPHPLFLRLWEGKACNKCWEGRYTGLGVPSGVSQVMKDAMIPRPGYLPPSISTTSIFFAGVGGLVIRGAGKGTYRPPQQSMPPTPSPIGSTVFVS